MRQSGIPHTTDRFLCSLAAEVRKYHILDSPNRKNHDAFECAFARLEKDLRTSIGEQIHQLQSTNRFVRFP